MMIGGPTGAFRPRPLAGPASGARGAAPPTALDNIQVLRGIAALAVLACHTFSYAGLPDAAEDTHRRLGELAGIMGVAVFFAISGYLMAGLVKRDDPWTFLVHRVVRIFPAYLAVVALFGLVFRALGIPFAATVFALFLAPAGPRAYPLGIEWTLLAETSFYVGLFLLALAGLTSRLVPVATAWLVGIVVARVLLPEASEAVVGGMPSAPYLLPFSPVCVPFAGGLLLPSLVARRWIRPWLVWPALALVAACIPLDPEARRWLAGLSAVLIVGAAVAARQLARGGALRRGAIVLGDWSYVLYLVHVPATVLVVRFLPDAASDPVHWLAMIVAALGLTALLGPCDLALYRRIRRRVDQASPIRLRRGLAVYLCTFCGFVLYGSAEVGHARWLEARTRDALSVLPPEAWGDAGAAEAAIAERGFGPAASLRGEVDGFERVASRDFVLGAWAFDPERPRERLMLAAFCGARRVGIVRPTRLRPALAALSGLEGSRGRRIGYQLVVPDKACAPGVTPLAVLVGPDHRMAVLPHADRPVAVSRAD